MGIIIDGGGDDGAHRRRLEWGPDPHGMAHYDISRQLLLFGFRYHHVAQRAHAGIHAIRAHAFENDGFHERAGRADSCLCVVRQRKRRAFGYIANLAPGKESIEKNALRHGVGDDGVVRFDWGAQGFAAAACARHFSRSLRSRSSVTPTSRELRMAPGLLNDSRTQAMPKSSRRSMAMCCARVSTRWNFDSSTNASTRFAIRL